MIRARQTQLGCLCILTLLIAAAHSGLALSTARGQDIPWFNNKPQVPDKITVFWTDTVLNQPGRKGVRGFGGRVMFFNSRQDKPVKVEGTFTVFAYDDTDSDLNKTVPDRKFIFTPDQVPKHYSKAKLGHSYSFWVPWDTVGGEQRTISLVCRFEPKDGGLVVSEPLKQILPGTAPLVKSKPKQSFTHETQFVDQRQQPPQANSGVQQAGYTTRAYPTIETERPRMQATTINLPPNYQWRQLDADRFAAAQQPALMQVEHAHALATGDYAPHYEAQPAAPATHYAPVATAGPDPQVVAAAAELLARALAQQATTMAASESGSPPPISRAQGEPIPRPRSDHVQMRPRPKGWPADQPPRPGSTAAAGHSVPARAESAELPQPIWTPAP